MPALTWYAARVRRMSPPEVLRAVRQRITAPWLRAPDERTRPALEQVPFYGSSRPLLPALRRDRDWLDQHGDALLAGRWGALQWDWCFEPDSRSVWHRAPDTGRLWPDLAAYRVDYRQGNAHGDARVIWEPARLQSLVPLGWLARDRPEAAALLDTALRSFAAANPPYRGVHYTSAMECALRILAVAFALDAARGAEGLSRSAWEVGLRLLECHAHFIENRLSLNSSGGNHTVAEAVGLLCAAQVLEGYSSRAQCQHWFATGWQLLTDELARQVRPDGGPLEQANAYLNLILDLGQIGYRLIAERDVDRAPLAAVLDRGYAFLEAFPPRPLATFGDADEGFALTPAWSGARDWLVEPAEAAPPAFHTYAETGISRWRGALDVSLDHGNLGMAPGFGHGHADALSLLLGDQHGAWLIDPGTYTYTGDASWRAYFRGTTAHNTVVFGHLDQAATQGPFLWAADVESRLAATWQQGDWRCALATHSGYRARGVLHWRGVAVSEAAVWVWDGLAGAAGGAAVAHWHLAPDVSADPQTGCWQRPAGAPLRVALRGGEARYWRGSMAPRLGWCAPAYGCLQPTISVRVTQHSSAPFLLAGFVASEREALEPPADAQAELLRRVKELSL